MITTSRKKIQIILILVGFILIAITYFIVPKIAQKIPEKTFTDEKITDTEETKPDTEFTNVEYQGLTADGNPYFVFSERAIINPDDPDIVIMTLITATFHYKDGRTVIVTSDRGRFNKRNGDIKFRENVKMVDSEENKLTSKNLDMLVSENYASAYNNVKLTTLNGQFVIADKIKFDAIKKIFKISMLDVGKKIKLKLVK